MCFDLLMVFDGARDEATLALLLINFGWDGTWWRILIKLNNISFEILI